MSPEEALHKLIEGNQRYVTNRSLHPHQQQRDRAEAAAGQHPFAVILGCSDSRVPPEIIFDEGLGDLFVVRTAGQVIDDAIVGSIEFAVAEFAAPLVLVLGHERCGAVRAAVEALAGGSSASGHIGSVVQAITPAVQQVIEQPGDVLDNAVRAHVAKVVAELRADEPILADLVRKGALRIVGARYDLDSGWVSIILP